ncbi:MAG: DUF3996 domain-containing protein [Treponema sp.]|jgi:hypothetical protein|nr:DUF3996 domain-containing protein [Treponema sp.]
MKKLFMVGVLGLALGITGVFAQHPSGWGIGIQGGLGLSGGGPALSLKVPSLPIFWAINLGFGGSDKDYKTSRFEIGVSGDYYFYDQALLPDIGLGWYLGGGGYFWFSNFTYHTPGQDQSWTGIGLGGRLPIGLSWMLPIPVKLELYLQAVPSLGIKFLIGDTYGDDYNYDVFDFGIGGNLGIRIWL